MWTWDQSAGTLSRDGVVISRGYSGKGAGKNNPAMEAVRGTGPLPRGRYRIGAPRTSARTGPFAMDLFPVDATPGDTRHDTTGRSAFQIHGDSVKAPGTASSGCIILPRAVRERIWNSGDHVIEVVQ
jgi:hypothetical protein